MTRIFLNRNVRVNSLISLNGERQREGEREGEGERQRGREGEKFQSTKLINGNKIFFSSSLKKIQLRLNFK